MLGRELSTLVNEVKFDAKNLTSKIYFYKLHNGEFLEIKKMTC